MLLEKGTKLLLERHLAMMDLLTGDIGNDRFFGRIRAPTIEALHDYTMYFCDSRAKFSAPTGRIAVVLAFPGVKTPG